MSREEVLFVDASGKVAGRLASIIAKKLLEGYRVVVLNVEKAVVTGRKETIMNRVREKLSLQSKVNPKRHGPFKPKTPEGIFRRMVRGMLPRKKSKGKEAFRRLRVYVGVPEEFRNVEITDFPEANYRRNPHGFMFIEEIARLLGWKPIREKLVGG